ncbi:MAG: hypothetical protein II575_14460, partial [Bacteroidales bacterium]|nr:hypothetical protein [Bacteroidales bacterium]
MDNLLFRDLVGNSYGKLFYLEYIYVFFEFYIFFCQQQSASSSIKGWFCLVKWRRKLLCVGCYWYDSEGRIPR